MNHGSESFEEFLQWRESIDNAPRPVRDAFERLTRQDPSPSQVAMNGISHYLAGRPDVPCAMLGVISHDWVGLTFEDVPELSAPWVQDEVDPKSWRIAHRDIADLDAAEGWSPQLLGLYSPGNNPENGEAVLYSTQSFRSLGLLGEERFVQAVMIGHVLQKAYETWNDDELLILVGYGELGEKIKIGTREVHPPGNVLTFDQFEEITPALLEDYSATIYWWGSDSTSLDRFEQVRGPRTGLVMDSHDERAAFFADEGQGRAALEPQCFSFDIHLTYGDDTKWKFIEVLWAYFQEDQEQALAGVTDESFDDFLSSLPADTAPADEETEEAGGLSPEGSAALAGSPTAQVELGEFQLSLLGEPEVRTRSTPLLGKAADAVALLHLRGGKMPVKELSECIWPGKETEGNTARQRRSRLKAAITEHVEVEADADSWTVPELSTDHQQILQALASPARYEPSALIEALEAIQPPLTGCAAWATDYRQTMTTELVERLESLPADLDAAVQDAAREALERVNAA
ncbi:hypothetical protein [Nesterenkonia sp. CF4.4]|uniref:hypothetical protein n=1 Tax=Nesterenkonia sp. CF4.4 TaxID=3373079 RepID=UPI003EE526C9